MTEILATIDATVDAFKVEMRAVDESLRKQSSNANKKIFFGRQAHVNRRNSSGIVFGRQITRPYVLLYLMVYPPRQLSLRPMFYFYADNKSLTEKFAFQGRRTSNVRNICLVWSSRKISSFFVVWKRKFHHFTEFQHCSVFIE